MALPQRDYQRPSFRPAQIRTVHGAFDTEKLDEIRSKYGADLYKECYTDALYEVMEAANVTAHLRLLGVSCKPIFTPDDCHVNYIAVFSLGNVTAPRINEIATKAGLCVLFQCPTH